MEAVQGRLDWLDFGGCKSECKRLEVWTEDLGVGSIDLDTKPLSASTMAANRYNDIKKLLVVL